MPTKKYDWPNVEYGSAEYHRLYRAANSEQSREKKRAYDSELYKRFPDRERERRKRYALKNPLKVSAHYKVRRAVASGRLEKLPCTVCGSQIVVAHHDDYNKPLDVTWFCELHHKARHREHKSIEPKKDSMDIVKDKFIKFRETQWQEVKDLAQELTDERGGHVALSTTIIEAIRFYKNNRPKSGL